MTDSDRSMSLHEEDGNGFSHKITPSQDYSVFALDLNIAVFKKFDNSKGRAGNTSGFSNKQFPEICRMKAVGILVRGYGQEDFLFFDMIGEGKLDENAVNFIVTIETADQVKEISEIIHNQGGLVYCDGANLNALMGIAKPGHMGVDVIQFNLHKTFSTPHGGGGPGSGPVGIKSLLEPFQPVPTVAKAGDRFRLSYDLPQSIGKIRSFYGNFGIFIRAYAYIRSMGSQGLKRASEMSVLNANYLRSRLEGTYHLPYPQLCMHECVFTDKHLAPTGITTLNVAKRLMDYGLHPPTIYFPLVVSGALMMEPTESESKESIDQFAEALLAISREAEINPEVVQSAPHLSKVRRLDETRAARQCRLKWIPEGKGE